MQHIFGMRSRTSRMMMDAGSSMMAIKGMDIGNWMMTTTMKRMV